MHVPIQLWKAGEVIGKIEASLGDFKSEDAAVIARIREVYDHMTKWDELREEFVISADHPKDKLIFKVGAAQAIATPSSDKTTYNVVLTCTSPTDGCSMYWGIKNGTYKPQYRSVFKIAEDVVVSALDFCGRSFEGPMRDGTMD